MDVEVRFKLVEEVRQQCRFAQIAFQQLKAELRSQDAERAFVYVHAFLNHSLSLSRLLWPDRAESQGRGETLREELQVENDSPLRVRDIKDELERPDERLEDWVSRLENRNYFEMNIMPQGTLSGYKTDVFHRSLDPDLLRFEYRGIPCDLRKMEGQIRRLETNADRWLKRHQPW